ncbi:hypothetical protein NSK_003684 [Nannochloropsis salina CCMP1776]|uniref:Uncharacterized protein n=1 Tax=Nannochloropsis salina CCMP1776 TaxID=1027361 RepID=A0A4D9D0R0_9STRA|nr:hypothetical protein NSK_003684 [Nannochloropsis salina CCMP1776]|eukprot:TFJ85261.1 hypothetical protein NSK_003684 [Nannochloropsis salina CCMP1776]
MDESWDFDFLPPGLGWTDLADPRVLMDEGVQSIPIDPWFHTTHAELYQKWSGRSSRPSSTASANSRRLSGKSRRCSNHEALAKVGLAVAAAADTAAAISLIPRRASGIRRSPDASGKPCLGQEKGGGVGREEKTGGGKVLVRGEGGGVWTTLKRPRTFLASTSVRIGTGREWEREEGTENVEEEEESGAPCHVGRQDRARAGARVKGGEQARREKLADFRMARVDTGPGVKRGGMGVRKALEPMQAEETRGGREAKTLGAGSGRGRCGAERGGRGGCRPTVKGARGGGKGGAAAAAEDEEMKALVALHNKKFRAAQSNPAYVPALSVRETKRWEAVTGRTYRSLSMREREEANAEIQAWKLRDI